MTSKSRLDAVLPKRLEALLRDLPAATDGDVEAVHRTRVASRRVREALPIVEGEPGRLRKVGRRTRALTRALGAVRELDVALELLARRPASSPEARGALEYLRARLGEEREARRRDMLARLETIKPDKLVRRIAGAVDEVPLGAEARWRESLAHRLDRRVERVRTALDHAGSLYLPDRLHQVRIALKKLRYGLEITGELRLAATASAVRTLKAVQDTLGHLQDIEVLGAHVRRAQAEVPMENAGWRAELDGLSRQLDDECRALHAKFLGARARVIATVEIAAAVSRRLTMTPVPATTGLAPRPRPS